MKSVLSLFLIICGLLATNDSMCQKTFFFSGDVKRADGKPVPNATVLLKGPQRSTMTNADGHFKMTSDGWGDSLQVSCIGYAMLNIRVQKGQSSGLILQMSSESTALAEVVIGASRKPGKSFMQKVIAKKNENDPLALQTYNFKAYTRSELDVDNIDLKKSGGKGLKSAMINAYKGVDSSAVNERELPVYFVERIANNYHSRSPKTDQVNLVAKKTLGLKADGLITKIDKFAFTFNVYDNWLAVFDQTYASPLHDDAFTYYNFFEGTTMIEDGETLQQIQFTPRSAYSRAFSGFMWINKNSLAVTTVNMRLSKNANINYVSDINYYEEYKAASTSDTATARYMPYKINCDVKFQSGLDLLGIPAQENKSTVKLVIKNTTVMSDLDAASTPGSMAGKNASKSKDFWQQERSEPLTDHEANIYRMTDSLKENHRFQAELKLMDIAGSGYWDMGNKLRVGPYFSLVSSNIFEGTRVRMGFWTLPGVNKKLNFYGYGAYGTKDQRLKGVLGAKYVWNEQHWTKTTASIGRDYDFMIDLDDELDHDNLLNSFLRKAIPFTKVFVKEAAVRHEQYLLPNLSAKASASYRDLTPTFFFCYTPIKKTAHRASDTALSTHLPVAEASIGLRFAKQERVKIFNYDRMKQGSFFPILTANYTHGFAAGSTGFNYDKIDVGIEHNLRLPPKSRLFYKIEAGKVFGTLPYLLLNIPSGSQYYVASRYVFNTMTPYEFASDRDISLHTRLHGGGILFDKVPLLQKLGWREVMSFNGYWGDMSEANRDYNKSVRLKKADKTPFMEASAGIENIFHVLSIEYFQRLSHQHKTHAKTSGVYLGFSIGL